MRHLLILALLAGAGCAAPAASAPEPLRLMDRKIDYTHGDVALQGYLAYDGAVSGKRPGILITHEWRGHNEYVRTRARALAAALLRLLVLAQPLEARLAQEVVLRPLGEGDLRHQHRLDPVGGPGRLRAVRVEGRAGLFEGAEPGAQVEQDLAGVAGADLARVQEALPRVVVVADEQ